jgi:hypothetical protein
VGEFSYHLQSPLPEFRAILYYDPPPAYASRRKKSKAHSLVNNDLRSNPISSYDDPCFP